MQCFNNNLLTFTDQDCEDVILVVFNNSMDDDWKTFGLNKVKQKSYNYINKVCKNTIIVQCIERNQKWFDHTTDFKNIIIYLFSY